MKRNFLIKTFCFVFAMSIMVLTKAQEQKKPSERSYATELVKMKEKLAAMHTLRQKLQLPVVPPSGQAANSSETGQAFPAVSPGINQAQRPGSTLQPAVRKKPSDREMIKPEIRDSRNTNSGIKE